MADHSPGTEMTLRRALHAHFAHDAISGRKYAAPLPS
jgi:hypothetical protein